MSSPRIRTRHADVTRRAILDAARRLFGELGYPNTTVRELAKAAGVAVRTVYLTFGSKEGVILELVEEMGRAAGEDEARARAAEAVDGATLMRIVAGVYRRFYERDFDLMAALRQGAGSSAGSAAAFEHGRGMSRANIGLICIRIEQLGDLRPDVDVDEAAGHALALVAPDAYEEMVRYRGWSHDRYEEWLTRALTQAVVRARPPGKRARGSGSTA